MGHGCMDRLSGKWAFLREPISEGKVQEVQLNSDATGKVTGTAKIVIEDYPQNPLNFDVSGYYGGVGLDINFISEVTDYGQVAFNFVGNCKDNNLFEGAIFGSVAGPFEISTGGCGIKHVG